MLRRVTDRRACRTLLTICIAAAATAASALAGATASAAAGTARSAAHPAATTAVHSAAATAAGRAGTAGIVTGTVNGPAGTPLRGVCVTATRPGGSTSALTGPGGRYTLGGLRPGQYKIGYRDCAAPAKYFEQWYGGANLPSAATRVSVGAGLPVRLPPVTLRLTSPAAEMAALQRGALRAGAPSGISPAAKAGWASGSVRSTSGRELSGICAVASAATAYGSESTGSVTGRKGGYSMELGTSGAWEVQFVGGCGNSGNWAPQWWRYQPAGRKLTYLHPSKSRGYSGINARLRKGAAISGTVTAAAGGQPLKGVCVMAVGTGGMRQVLVQSVTGSSGTYVLKNLGTGSYRVSFDPECGQQGNYLSTSRASLVKATDGKTTTGISAALRPGAEISGVVTSQAGGTPVAGICVDLSTSTAGGLNEVFTDASGAYSFTQLRAGSYLVGFSGGCGNTGSYAPIYYSGQSSPYAATPVPVAAAQDVTGIDQAMPAGGTITGTATTSAGAPLRGVCVLVTSKNAAGGLGTNPFLETEAAGSFTNFAATGKSGGYSVANLEPGLYQAVFMGGCGNGTLRYSPRIFAPQGGSGWVSVGTGTTAGVSAALSPGGSISGTVTGRDGRKLYLICVVAVAAGQPAVTTADEFTVPQTRNGSYTLPGLPAGKYAVQFQPCVGQPYAAQWYGGAAGRAQARLVTVASGHATTGISATLTSGDTVSGKVVSAATGKPAVGACMLLTDSSGDPVAGALSNSSGEYRLPHVLAGRWTVDASMCEAATPALGGIARKGVRVHGATTSLTLRLPKAGQITGTVTGGASAAAEPGICVEATPVSGDAEPGLAVTGADGGYDLTGLAPGGYRVQFTPYCLPGMAAVVPQWYNGSATRTAATPVTVTAGQVSPGIGATLADDGGISGTVSVSSALEPGVCVGAYAGSSATPADIAVTGVDGSYQLAGLAPGSYTVEFTAGCGTASYSAQWYSGAATQSAATPVTVTSDNVSTGIDAS